MKLLVICGGDGKTTLTKKYPDLFLDITPTEKKNETKHEYFQ